MSCNWHKIQVQPYKFCIRDLGYLAWWTVIVRQNNFAGGLYCGGLLVVTGTHPGWVKRGVDAWGSDFCRKWLCFPTLTSDGLIKNCSASLLQTWSQEVVRLFFRCLALSTSSWPIRTHLNTGTTLLHQRKSCKGWQQNGRKRILTGTTWQHWRRIFCWIVTALLMRWDKQDGSDESFRVY